MFFCHDKDVLAIGDSRKNSLAHEFDGIFDAVLTKIIKARRKKVGVNDRDLKPAIPDVHR